MNKETILKDIAEVNELKKEVEKKQKIVNIKSQEVKNNFRIFLADQNIELTERYAVWIKAPREMLDSKSLYISKKENKDLSELVKPFLWALAEYGFNYDEEINIVQETMRCFWNGTDLKLTDQEEVFYNFEQRSAMQSSSFRAR